MRTLKINLTVPSEMDVFKTVTDKANSLGFGHRNEFAEAHTIDGKDVFIDYFKNQTGYLTIKTTIK